MKCIDGDNLILLDEVSLAKILVL